MPIEPKREKNREHLYTRSVELIRAKQLGVEYPVITEAQPTQDMENLQNSGQTIVLFVCSRNQWRSPTAEQVWRRHPCLSVRSGGTSPSARHPVSVRDLSWAQVIFVREDKHKSRLIADYRRVLEHKPIHVLDIPDEYKFMDPELVNLLRVSVREILGLQ